MLCIYVTELFNFSSPVSHSSILKKCKRVFYFCLNYLSIFINFYTVNWCLKEEHTFQNFFLLFLLEMVVFYNTPNYMNILRVICFYSDRYIYFIIRCQMVVFYNTRNYMDILRVICFYSDAICIYVK